MPVRWSSIVNKHGEKLRYLAVGAFNTLCSYILYVAMLATLGDWLQTLSGASSGLAALTGDHYYLVVQWVAWVVASPFCTMTMKRFAFRSRGHWLRQIGRGYLVYLPAQGLASVLLWLTVTILHVVPQLGVIIVVMITTVLTYVGHKFFTFHVPLEVGDIPPERLIE